MSLASRLTQRHGSTPDTAIFRLECSRPNLIGACRVAIVNYTLEAEGVTRGAWYLS